MRGAHAAWALVTLTAGGCLDIPARNLCVSTEDCDGDGWTVTALRPDAADCDDRDPAINPGAQDDPMTAFIEDCAADASAPTLAGVTALARGWAAGGVEIEFDSSTTLPSRLRVGGRDVLGFAPGACTVSNEQGIGVSLYPAFAAHGSTPQVGERVTDRAGLVFATSRVTWRQSVPAAAMGFGCDAATTVIGTTLFTVHPSGLIVRDDSYDVTSSVATCAGCANTGGTSPILAAYTTFLSTMDRYQFDGQPMSTAFPAAGTADPLSPSSREVFACVFGGAAVPQAALALHLPAGVARLRLRTTNDGMANRAVVTDFVSSAMVPAGTYRLTTALRFEDDAVADCSVGLRQAIAEQSRPPTVTNATFRPELGIYDYTAPVTAGNLVTAQAGITGGAVFRVPTLGETTAGVTVWRSSGAGWTRLRRGRDYLTQRDADLTLSVYVPSLDSNHTLDLAGPGGEPPP